MKFLELPDEPVAVVVHLDPNQPCEKEPENTYCQNDITVADGQPLISRVVRGRGKLVKGTLLSGRVFQRQIGQWTVAFRWNEATLPDGSKHPVCMEGGDPSDPGATPGTWMVSNSVQANTYWGWRDTAELTH
jgi:hypothetical protein